MRQFASMSLTNEIQFYSMKLTEKSRSSFFCEQLPHKFVRKDNLLLISWHMLFMSQYYTSEEFYLQDHFFWNLTQKSKVLHRLKKCSRHLRFSINQDEALYLEIHQVLIAEWIRVIQGVTSTKLSCNWITK